MPTPLLSRRCGPLTGSLTPPGDKSMSHRAIMLGGIAQGITTVTGLLEGEDVLRTVGALRALGAYIEKQSDGQWRVEGVGLDGLRGAGFPLDLGNSGTSARLLMGLLAGQAFASRLTGDASLRRRPMGRVIEPLSRMGAVFESNEGRLPLTMTGTAAVQPITYTLPVASAQVKSAILLAGLRGSGVTTVIEPAATRDHTENMLRAFGVTVTIESTPAGEAISLAGGQELTGQSITVPGDPSSAAFPLVAALLQAGSTVTLPNIGLNPRRAGLVATLIEMGADIKQLNPRVAGGEPVADLAVTGGGLTAIDVPPERAPSMIDEYPVLAVACACANGTSRLRGLGELRVKESDRLALVADGLTRCGVRVEITGDDLIIFGTGRPPPGGATVATAMDHRIAMSFLVLGTVTNEPVTVDDGAFIATSFPGFVSLMNGLGAKIADA